MTWSILNLQILKTGIFLQLNGHLIDYLTIIKLFRDEFIFIFKLLQDKVRFNVVVLYETK